jgi:hypothetical protein
VVSSGGHIFRRLHQIGVFQVDFKRRTWHIFLSEDKARNSCMVDLTLNPEEGQGSHVTVCLVKRSAGREKKQKKSLGSDLLFC